MLDAGLPAAARAFCQRASAAIVPNSGSAPAHFRNTRLSSINWLQPLLSPPSRLRYYIPSRTPGEADEPYAAWRCAGELFPWPTPSPARCKIGPDEIPGGPNMRLSMFTFCALLYAPLSVAADSYTLIERWQVNFGRGEDRATY